MDDLTRTKLCAEAMGLRWSPGDGATLIVETNANMQWWEVYDPLHDDAQAMALVKRFKLQVSHRAFFGSPSWLVAFPFATESNFVGHHTRHEDLNHAIVECVAQMQAAKSGHALQTEAQAK